MSLIKTKTMKESIPEITRETGVRFKVFRQEKNLTQTEIGKYLEKGKSTIMRYEVGEIPIPADAISTLQTRLGLDVEWFFTGEKSKVKANAPGSLLKDISQLNENNKLLAAKVKMLEKEFLKLHNELYELKHGVQKRDTSGTN